MVNKISAQISMTFSISPSPHSVYFEHYDRCYFSWTLGSLWYYISFQKQLIWMIRHPRMRKGSITNKDLITWCSEAWKGKLTCFILHMLLSKNIRGKRNNIYKCYEDIWRLTFSQFLLSLLLFWVVIICNSSAVIPSVYYKVFHFLPE